jgi:hypothetical protein
LCTCAHGKDANTFWYGEADYTGACQPARDPDCDYWYSEHDSLPTTFNPQQVESFPATPCSGLCDSPVPVAKPDYHSGSLGSNATCHEFKQAIAGFRCGQLAGARTMQINGQTVECERNLDAPPMRNGGYCIQSSAGQFDWAFFTTW